jgi:hypothetical protein
LKGNTMANFRVIRAGRTTQTSVDCETWPAVQRTVREFVSEAVQMKTTRDIFTEMIMERAGTGEPFELPNGKTVEVIDISEGA